MKKIRTMFDEQKIEHRPIVAGNLLLHPFLAKWKDSIKVPNANILMIEANLEKEKDYLHEIIYERYLFKLKIILY